MEKFKTEIIDLISGGIKTKDIKKHLNDLVPEYRDYALKNLPTRLIEVERFEQLYEWLIDFDFIEAKVSHSESSIQALIDDYNLAISFYRYFSSEQETVLKIIRGALQLSEHILKKDNTRLAERLWGHIGIFQTFQRTEIENLLNKAKESKTTPWLRPIATCLAFPGTGLLGFITGHNDLVTSILVTPNSEYVISGSDDKTLKVWNWKTGEEVRTLSGHTDSVTSIAITPNGKYVISGSKDKTIKVWNWKTGEEVRTLSGHTDPVTSIAITLDGKHVISSFWRMLKVWNWKTGEEVHILINHMLPIQQIAVTPDGKHLISVGWDKIVVWNWQTGERIHAFFHHKQTVKKIAVTPDGKYLVSISIDLTSFTNNWTLD